MSLPANVWIVALALLCIGGAAVSAEVPPAPDYAHADAWAAWPGRPSGADSVPPGVSAPASPESSQADVFFIHPTTYLTGGARNARYDEPGVTTTRIDQGVLRFQASAFNGCCRIYAPHYRQAAFGAFFQNDDAAAEAAFEIAYGDVSRAFDYYIAHENHNRPFIIASHSQGSLHAMRLLQERIAGRALLKRLVAAYVVGYYVPQDIERSGVPVCRLAAQTGCLVDWNSVKTGTSDAARERSRLIWLEGRYQHTAGRAMICVNPLNWQPDAEAAAVLNLGALPAVAPGQPLHPPVPHLTAASCHGPGLEVDIPLTERRGFANPLLLSGSYHLYDYNLFYVNIRTNAQERVTAWRKTATARGSVPD